MTDEEYICAFVDGAAWWEFDRTGATMWASDRRRASDHAKDELARLAKLAQDPEWVAHQEALTAALREIKGE